MKTFVQIDQNNLVINALVVAEDKDEKWLTERFGGIWKPTDETNPKLIAGVGYEYLPEQDGFILPKPYESWSLNIEEWKWEAPLSYPSDGKDYKWDEENQDWILLKK